MNAQVLFSITPWDADQEDILPKILEINGNTLLWGAYTHEDIGFGIKNLLITATLDESMLSVREVLEKMQSLDDIVSRVEILLWNRV
jgi:translation elongation factor EF-1beta